MQTIGSSLLEVTPGPVEIEQFFDQRLTQQDEFIHAGVSATVGATLMVVICND